MFFPFQIKIWLYGFDFSKKPKNTRVLYSLYCTNVKHGRFPFAQQVATKYPANAVIHRPTLLGYIVSTKVWTAISMILNFVCFHFVLCCFTFYGDNFFPWHNWLIYATFFLFLVLASPVWRNQVDSYYSAKFILQIKTPAQLEAAFSFLSSTASESFELKEFEEACGVGKLSLWSII